MNAAIQMLRTIPELRRLCENEFTKLNNPDELLVAFYTMANKMNETSQATRCKPGNFLNVLKKKVAGTVYSEFAENTPHDSHEFMMYLLDKFGENLKCGQLVVNEDTHPEWYTVTKSDYNILTELIYGLDKITYTCTTCMNKSVRWETFNTLKVPVKGYDPKVSIEDRLHDTRKVFHIDEYACEKCNAPRRVEVTAEIWKMPPILFITLDRFSDPVRKVTDTVELENTHTFKSLFASECCDESASWTYEPISIIDHHGSLHGGHYTCQILHGESDGEGEGESTRQWYMYDDETSQQIKSPAYGYSTYVLCLHRRENSVLL
jgi:ubiquitin C-terminal hydrolase